MKKKLLLTSLTLLIGNSWAVVPASVDRTEVTLGQSFTLTINMPSSSDNPNLDILKNNFDLFGTSSSSQTSIINGKISSQNTLTVNLVPKNAGKQIIPAIKVGNDTTAPITINVVAGDNKQLASVKNNDISIDATTEQKLTYVGVPFLYKVKLYFRVTLNNVNMEPIVINGAQIQPQGKSSQYQAKIGANNYQVVEQQFLVTPTRAGNITIPAAKISGNTVTNGGDPFMMMGGGKPFMVTSKPLTMSVKDIPKTIRPNEWFPAKQLNISDSWSINSDQINVGDPLTHTITLEALGVPATAIPELSFTTPSGVNAYPDKSQSSTGQNAGDLVGTKTFKTAYIATKTGEVVFPEVKIKWWDITSDSLKEATIPAKTFKVVGDANNVTSNKINASDASANHDDSMRETQIKNGSVNTFWQYLAIIFAGLWALTILITFKLWLMLKRKPHEIYLSNGGGSLNDTAQQTTTCSDYSNPSLKQACQDKNINALSSALLVWATKYSTKKLYTVTDIKTVMNDSELHDLIDKLSAAIYNGQDFSDFAIVEMLIHKIDTFQAKNKTPEKLQTFYPK